MTRQNLFYGPVYFCKTTVTGKRLELLLRALLLCACTPVYTAVSCCSEKWNAARGAHGSPGLTWQWMVPAACLHDVFFWNWPQQATEMWVSFIIIVCCIQTCTKLSEPIGTDSRIRYIKFGVKRTHIYITDPFNYIVVEAHDLVRQDSGFRRARYTSTAVYIRVDLESPSLASDNICD